MDIRFSVAICACITQKISFAHAEKAPAMDEPSDDGHFHQWKWLRQVVLSQKVMVCTFTSWNMPAMIFLIYTYVGTRQRNRRACPNLKQRRWSFHSNTLASSSLLQDARVKSIFCLRIDIKMLKYHLFDVTFLGSRDPKVTKNQWLHRQFRTQFQFLSLVLLNSSIKVHFLVYLLCFT